MAIYNPYKKDDEKVTQPNFGGARSISFTDPNTINRQRALADSLRQQSMIPLQAQSAGGYVIPSSPLSGVNKILQGYLGRRTEEIAKEKEEANKQLRSDAVAKALRLQQEGVRDKFEGNVVPNYAFGGSTRREATRPDILGALAEGGPDMEKLIAESQIKNLLADASGSTSSTAAAIQIDKYIKSLPEDEAKQFRQDRFAGKVYNDGQNIYVPNNEGGHDKIPLNLKPGEEILYKQELSDMEVEENRLKEKEKTKQAKLRVKQELTLKTDNISEEEFEKNKGKWTGNNSTLISSLGRAKAKRDKMAAAIHRAKDIILKEKSAGWDGVFSILPESSAKALANELLMIKANIGFGVLEEMRNNSPTGGAVGQLSDPERQALEATIGSLDQFNREEDLIRALDNILDDREGLYERMITDYQSDYAKYGEEDDKAYENYTAYPAYEGPDVKLKKIKRYNPKTDEIEEI